MNSKLLLLLVLCVWLASSFSVKLSTCKIKCKKPLHPVCGCYPILASYIGFSCSATCLPPKKAVCKCMK